MATLDSSKHKSFIYNDLSFHSLYEFTALYSIITIFVVLNIVVAHCFNWTQKPIARPFQTKSQVHQTASYTCKIDKDSNHNFLIKTLTCFECTGNGDKYTIYCNLYIARKY